MSDLSEIHKKIDGVKSAVDNLCGKFEATLPHLATKADISSHAINCRHSRYPTKDGKNGAIGKLLALLGTCVAALVAVIYALINYVG